MISPNKAKSLYGGDTLFRGISLANDVAKTINRNPEQVKALQQVRRENMNTAIKLKKEAIDLFEGVNKNKNFKPTTDYQKAIFNSSLKMSQWDQDEARQIAKEQREHKQRLLDDNVKVSSGWLGLVGFMQGLSDEVVQTRKSYVDNKGVKSSIELDGGDWYKVQGGKKTIASDADLQESGINNEELRDVAATKIKKSTGYYMGHQVGVTMYNIYKRNLVGDALSGLNAFVRLGRDNAVVIDKALNGDYNSVGEAWNDVGSVNSNSLKSMWHSFNGAAYGVEAKLANLVGATEWEKDATSRKAENDILLKKADKELKQWYTDRTKEIKKNGSNNLSGLYDKAVRKIQDKASDAYNDIEAVSTLNSALKQRALELEGRAEKTFSQKNKEIDKTLYTDPKTGRKFVNEKVDDSSKEAGGKASAFDIKILSKDSDGFVQFDSEGKEIYLDKFSIWEAFKDSNSSAVFDKYFFGDVVLTEGIESLGDIASTVMLSKGLGVASKGLKAASKASGVGGSMTVAGASAKNLINKAIPLNANKFFVNQGDKLLNKVLDGTSKVTNRVSDTSLGKKLIGGKKIQTKFTPSIQDNLLGSKGVYNTRLKEFGRNMLIAYMQGAGESEEIAVGVRNKIMEEKVDKLAGIDVEKIAMGFMEQDPSLDTTTAFLRAGNEADKLRSDWLTANPEDANEVLAFAQLGQEVARATNNLGFITNLGQVSAVLKSKTLSRSIKTNPYDAINPVSLIRDLGKGISASRGILSNVKNKKFGSALKNTLQTTKKTIGKTIGNESIKQGLIEGVLEEGFLNTSAERAGLAAGRGEAYRLVDIFNNIDSELAESMYAGFVIGAGQSKASSVISGVNGGYREYKDQRRMIKNMLDRTPETREQINNFFETSLATTNLTENLDKIAELEKPTKIVKDKKTGKDVVVPKTKKELREDALQIEELHRDTFVSNAMFSASRGLSGVMDDVIDRAMKQPDLTPEDILQLQEAKDLNSFVSKTFDRFASTPGYDPTTITLNRVERRLLEDTLKDVESYSSMIDSALSERESQRTKDKEDDKDYLNSLNNNEEAFDILASLSEDFEDIGELADSDLRNLKATKDQTIEQLNAAIRILDDGYKVLLENGSKQQKEGVNISYLQNLAIKKALAGVSSEAELEAIIQDNKELALGAREDFIAKREALKAEVIANAASKVPTDEEIEAEESPELAEHKRRVSEGLFQEDQFTATGARRKPKSKRRLKKEAQKRGEEFTPLKKKTKKDYERGQRAQQEQTPTEEIPETPEVEEVTPQDVPEVEGQPEEVEEDKTIVKDQEGNVIDIIDEALEIIDEVNRTPKNTVIEGYQIGSSVEPEDVIGDSDIIEDIFDNGNIPVLVTLDRSGDGKLIGTLQYTDDPEDIIQIELKEREVLESMKQSGDYSSYKIGQPISKDMILEWSDGRTKMDKNYTKYGNPEITKLPDKNGTATVKFVGGPSARIKLRRQTIEEIQIEDLNESMALAAEKLFGIPVGDKAKIGDIVVGDIPDGLEEDTIVEIASYFGPLDEVMVMTGDNRVFYIEMRENSSRYNLDYEDTLAFSQREALVDRDLNNTITEIIKVNPTINTEDLLSLLLQNNIVEKNC